jgi:predicted nucleic acid-binding protein
LAAAVVEVADGLPLPIQARNPGDDKVLTCALAAGADAIVTGDADLLALDGHPALGVLRILRPADFLAPLDARNRG